jgi:small subunit ribosomal protein S21
MNRERPPPAVAREALRRNRRQHVATGIAGAPEAALLSCSLPQRRDHHLQILVRDNNIDQALRVLKKKMQREGVFREMKLRRFYEKPSERAAREHNEAIRRRRKLARKKAQREGLLPDPRAKKKLLEKKQDPRRPGQALGNRN